MLWRVGPILVSLSLLVVDGAARADGPRRDPATPVPGTVRTEGPPSGADQPPVGRDGPLELRIWLENDNLLLGSYGGMAGAEHDGNDLGRTHAAGFRVAYDVDDRWLFELDAATALFTRSVNGDEPRRMMILPIYFNELSWVRLGLGLERPDGPWRLRFGVGLDVSNHERVVAIGASGQQNAWHRFLRYTLGTETWIYEYVPDGAGIHVGAATDVHAGGLTRAELASILWLEAEGGLGGRLGSLPGASWVEARGRVAMGLGHRRGVRLVVGAEQRAYVWLESPGVMLRSTIDARLDFQVLALEVAVHRYDGDQNERYFVYAFDNVTMTVAIWLRI